MHVWRKQIRIARGHVSRCVDDVQKWICTLRVVLQKLCCLAENQYCLPLAAERLLAS